MTSSKLRAALFAASLGAALALPCAAFAQASAGDLESAREIYKQGKELRASGDLKGALDKFKAAHALGQTPVTALELGRTHMDLGHLVEAREVFLSVSRIAVQSDEGEKSAAARAESAQLADSLRPRIPTLLVKVTGVPEGTTPSVTLDGVLVPTAALQAARKLNPGVHEVTARAGDGPEEKASIDLREGDSKELPIAVKWLAPHEAPIAAAAPAGPADKAEGATRMNPLVFVGFGVAGVGAVAGTITGLVAVSKASKVDGDCGGTTVCPPSAKSDITTGRTMGTISTISFLVAAAGVGVGIYGLASPVKVTKAAALRVHPELGFGWLGVRGAF